ncbi:hypothetical protein [Paenibacillus sp. GP183]|uniref:hypothetical protein n=1 Tax=Paenibacillus sp. GP183 TaxID=1882751 RepID=UPI0011152C48|nr:hypothetical protein [Paenibacillus sp. GP183]
MKELKKYSTIKSSAEAMLDKIFLGMEVPFTQEDIADRLKVSKQKIEELNLKKTELNNSRSREKISQEDLLQLSTVINEWSSLFDHTDITTRKVMLSKIVDKVVVHKDKIDIKINLKLEEFFEAVMGTNSEVSSALDTSAYNNSIMYTVGTPTVNIETVEIIMNL